jgi:FkbM family methyltransferase
MRMAIRGWIKSFVRYLLALAVANRATIPVLIGVARGCKVPRGVAMTNPSILFGRYEQAVTDAISKIERPIRVAYDVGAHVGLTTIILAKRFGDCCSVVAFDPSRENVASLELLVAANRMKNVTIVPIGLSDECGNAQFLRSGAAYTGRLSAVAAEDSTLSPIEQTDLVRTQTLDSFVFDEGRSPPEFVKIDVEGAEARVVRGGARVIAKYHPVLLIELHGPKHAGEVWDPLREQAYRWTYIDPRHGPVGNISEQDQLLAYFGPDTRWTQRVLLC